MDRGTFKTFVTQNLEPDALDALLEDLSRDHDIDAGNLITQGDVLIFADMLTAALFGNEDEDDDEDEDGDLNNSTLHEPQS